MKIFQVDAFTQNVFGGNPAAVCPLTKWPDDSWMQKLAMEINLSETAFFTPEGEGFRLRWFTPRKEVDLCGHATLATAHILFTTLGYSDKTILFYTRSGELSVSKWKDWRYIMDLPTDFPKPESNTEILSAIEKGIGIKPVSVWRGKDDYLIEVHDQSQVEELKPDFRIISALLARGIIVTATGRDSDFVSRAFYPSYGIDEDPVTGSAHTLLTPFWAPRLKTNTLEAIQLSSRKGYLTCVLKGERTALLGSAVTSMEGELCMQGLLHSGYI